jgi:uncharacterized membrane protein YgcG
MKIFGWSFALLLFAMPARAQDCDSIVADQVGVLQPAQIDQVKVAAQALIDEGADVRVRVIGTTANLDMDEKNVERSCVSWRSPNDGRKSSLVVLMVSPQSHKMGIYFGEAFKPALEAHWNRIKQDYMAPHFKTGDWAAGFIATEQQLGARIKASRDEAVHPAASTATTINQPADLTGLWRVMMWMLFFAAIGGVIWIFVAWFRKMRKEEQELREAQRGAIDTKARAADLLKNSISHPRLDEASQEFTRLNASIRNDPYSDDLAVEEYNVIASQYQKVVDMLSYSRKPYVSPSGPAPDVRHKKTPRRPSAGGAGGDAAASQTAAAPTVGGFPVPVPIVEEPIIIEEPRLRDPEPEPERHSHSSSDDSGGGGSSSWSSDSSSSDSGGGSSDFGGDSGGGDSGGGGGGSSDF